MLNVGRMVAKRNHYTKKAEKADTGGWFARTFLAPLYRGRAGRAALEIEDWRDDRRR